MKATLPFVYTDRVLMGGKPRRVMKLGQVSAEVPEVSLRDVKMVASWKLGGIGHDNPQVMCVAWDGDLYLPVRNRGQVQLRVMPRHAFDAHIVEYDHLVELTGLYDAVPIQEFNFLVDALEGRRKVNTRTYIDVLESDGGGRRAFAQSRVDSLLNVSGAYWRKVPYLAFKLAMHENGSVFHTIEGGVPDYGLLGDGRLPARSPSAYLHFPLRGLDQMVSFAGPPDRQYIHDLEIDADFPDGFDTRSELVARTVGSVLRSCEDRLGDMSVDELGVVLKMRTAAMAFYRDPSTTIGDGIVEALSDFSTTVTDRHAALEIGEALVMIDRLDGLKSIRDLPSGPR